MADSDVKEFVNSVVNDQSKNAKEQLVELLKKKCADRITKCLDKKA